MTTFPIRERLPEYALASGRIGYDLDARYLLLHTIQTTEAVEALLADGILHPDLSRAEPAFADAYDWIYRKMSEQLPTDGEGALWFWARIRRADLVSHCRQGRGDVLLTCRIPRERVLLSHFMDWHMALNRSLAIMRSPGETEDQALERWDRASDAFSARLRDAGVADTRVRDWPAPLRTEVEQSWECILSRHNYGSFECWQATTHALLRQDVVEATRLTAT